MIQIRRLSSADTNFDETLGQLLAFEDAQDATVEAAVSAILADIKKRGDEALLDYTHRFDGLVAASTAELELPHDRMQKALNNLPDDQRHRVAGRRPRADP